MGSDPRRALGPAAHPPHQQAGHVTAPDQCCRSVRKFLPRRRPHVTQSGHYRARPIFWFKCSYSSNRSSPAQPSIDPRRTSMRRPEAAEDHTRRPPLHGPRTAARRSSQASQACSISVNIVYNSPTFERGVRYNLLNLLLTFNWPEYCERNGGATATRASWSSLHTWSMRQEGSKR